MLATITNGALLFQSPPGVRLRPSKTKAKGTWSLYHQPPQPPALVSRFNLSTSPNHPKPNPLSWSAPIPSVYRTYVTSSIASQESSPVLLSRTSSIMWEWTSTTGTALIHTGKPTSNSDKHPLPLHIAYIFIYIIMDYLLHQASLQPASVIAKIHINFHPD